MCSRTPEEEMAHVWNDRGPRRLSNTCRKTCVCLPVPPQAEFSGGHRAGGRAPERTKAGEHAPALSPLPSLTDTCLSVHKDAPTMAGSGRPKEHPSRTGPARPDPEWPSEERGETDMEGSPRCTRPPVR